jgi:hypothetical protein
VLRRHFLTYLALSTAAVGQPLLDLYGRNITVFTASKLSPFEVVLFVVLVLLVPALLASVVDWFSAQFGPRVNEATRVLLVGGFGALIGLAFARNHGRLASTARSAVVAIVVGVALAYLYDKKRVVRQWSRYLSVLAPVLLGVVILQLYPVISPTGGATSDAVVSNKNIPVLEIITDELPVFSLLGPDHNINAERFPGMAELASLSTWYRNSAAASNFTHQAVPAIMSSKLPTPSGGGGPVLAAYPHNIFTLYRNRLPVGAIEAVTSLCPTDECHSQVAGVGGVFKWGRFKSFVHDAVFVYAQRVMPPAIRRHLPSVTETWGGFGQVKARFDDEFAAGPLSQQRNLTHAVQSFASTRSGHIEVVHVLMPHQPWVLTPDEHITTSVGVTAGTNPIGFDAIRDQYQTYLDQMVAVDASIKQAIDTLKAEGVWDKSLVIFTADHGISFLSGEQQRNSDFTNPDQVDDIYRVPTFIKYPGQTSGEVSDCAISNLDLLPTINDVLGTKTSWHFDGYSVKDSCPQRNGRPAISNTGQSSTIGGDFQNVISRSNFYNDYVSMRGGPAGISAIDSSSKLIGLPINSSVRDSRVVGWSLNQAGQFKNISSEVGSVSPVTITGLVKVSSPLPKGTEGVVAVDGRAAGVIGELSGDQTDVNFISVLDYKLLTPGSHTVELLVRSPEGVLTRVGAPS